jgi:hypothetical protein
MNKKLVDKIFTDNYSDYLEYIQKMAKRYKMSCTSEEVLNDIYLKIINNQTFNLAESEQTYHTYIKGVIYNSFAFPNSKLNRERKQKYIEPEYDNDKVDYQDVLWQLELANDAFKQTLTRKELRLWTVSYHHGVRCKNSVAEYFSISKTATATIYYYLRQIKDLEKRFIEYYKNT